MMGVIRLNRSERGQGLVEYLLILGLIGFAVAAGMTTMANYLNQVFSSIGAFISSYIS
jgi:Flp pilus assembly pilin Flp